MKDSETIIIKVIICIIMIILLVATLLDEQTSDSKKYIIYGDARTNDGDLNTNQSPAAAYNNGNSASDTLQVTVEEHGNRTNSLSFPLRGVFNYPCYPQTWSVSGEHVSYNVEPGFYSSDDPDVVDQHIEDLDYAKIDVTIASWRGVGRQNEEESIPLLFNLTTAAGSPLKWAVYNKMEEFSYPGFYDLNSNLAYLNEQYTSHVAYAHVEGKPVIFVFNANGDVYLNALHNDREPGDITPIEDSKNLPAVVLEYFNLRLNYFERMI